MEVGKVVVGSDLVSAVVQLDTFVDDGEGGSDRRDHRPDTHADAGIAHPAPQFSRGKIPDGQRGRQSTKPTFVNSWRVPAMSVTDVPVKAFAITGTMS
jgi:hypothetical protein